MKLINLVRRYWLAGVLAFALAVAASYGWYRFNLLPADSMGNEVNFDIAAGEVPAQIAADLQSKRLIRNQQVWLAYVNIHGLRPRLQAGAYALNPRLSGPELARALAEGRLMQDFLVIPEGSTLKQVQALAERRGMDKGALTKALGQDYDYTFLKVKPLAAHGLEGYLFPDSYRVGEATTPEDLVRQMLSNFDAKITPQIVEGFKKQGLNLHQGLTLASMVEKEVSAKADRALVAQVFLNRIRAGHPLESDVTIHYVTDQTGQAFSTNLDSPYNTYKNPGLPLGPICNPGMESIMAVVNPQPTDYLYFVADKHGKTHYAKTFAEHQKNVAQYLR